jgi:hypothetical protein
LQPPPFFFHHTGKAGAKKRESAPWEMTFFAGFSLQKATRDAFCRRGAKNKIDIFYIFSFKGLDRRANIC